MHQQMMKTLPTGIHIRFGGAWGINWSEDIDSFVSSLCLDARYDTLVG